MLEAFHHYYAYWFLILLLVIGLYGMLMKRNLMKKVIGMIIFQNSIILFFIVAAFKDGGTVPVLDPALSAGDVGVYMNPLPHTLMLTAIVVGVAIVGVAFALLIKIHGTFGTLDEPLLLERMRENPMEGGQE